MRLVTSCIIAMTVAALPAAAQTGTSLFDGTLSGWDHVGPGAFTADTGVLMTHGGMGLLWYTKRKIGNEVIRVVFWPTDSTSNSGVFIRIPEKPTEPWMPVNKGYEVQIDNAEDEYHVSGVLYSLTKALARPGKARQWNTLEITLDGPHTTVRLNGELVTDYTEGQPVPPKKQTWEPDRGRRPNLGYIGLQNHSDADTVYFKEISVRPLHP
ncbi:MAG TPA: DUF1080 domain-containing protein [Gemmatimonadales bacterium]|jgi:hypothetical protein|nr:DUF1080 domain-containing protein [Gemmatimonadales bacterium]